MGRTVFGMSKGTCSLWRLKTEGTMSKTWANCPVQLQGFCASPMHPPRAAWATILVPIEGLLKSGPCFKNSCITNQCWQTLWSQAAPKHWIVSCVLPLATKCSVQVLKLFFIFTKWNCTNLVQILYKFRTNIFCTNQVVYCLLQLSVLYRLHSFPSNTLLCTGIHSLLAVLLVLLIMSSSISCWPIHNGPIFYL